MHVYPPLTFFFGIINYYLQAGLHIQDFPKRIPKTGVVFTDTNSGRIMGTQHYSRGQTNYNYFRGIPYAKAPLGNLRFEPPQRHPGWSGTLDATKYGPQCWQVVVPAPKQPTDGDEDCLFLNIATRQSFLRTKVPMTGFRPVIVWIHGGHFMTGSSDHYPPKYFMEEDIVYVAVNYRLISFGFLNTGDDVVLGNMGLKDQAMALRWIQDNIKYFNGDPARVTIMGQSAGGSSVHLHMLSKFSEGLFSRAISLSGTALSPWALVHQPEMQARELGNAMGCNSNSSVLFVDCLKKIPAHILTQHHTQYIDRAIAGSRAFFGPTLEFKLDNPNGNFMSTHPLVIMEQGNTSNVPWINGVMSGEGLVVLIPFLRNETLLRTVNDDWCQASGKFLFYSSHPKICQVADALRQQYLNGQPLSINNIANASMMASDVVFFSDSRKSALWQAKVAPVYVFYYAYEGLFSFMAETMDERKVPLVSSVVSNNILAVGNWAKANVLKVKPRNKYGVCHGDELPILFNAPFIRREIEGNDDDLEFSRKLIRLYVSFAETGVPDLQKIGVKLRWPTVREANPNLSEIPLRRLLINDTFRLIDEPFFERLGFLDKLNMSLISPV